MKAFIQICMSLGILTFGCPGGFAAGFECGSTVSSGDIDKKYDEQKGFSEMNFERVALVPSASKEGRFQLILSKYYQVTALDAQDSTAVQAAAYLNESQLQFKDVVVKDDLECFLDGFAAYCKSESGNQFLTEVHTVERISNYETVDGRVQKVEPFKQQSRSLKLFFGMEIHPRFQELRLDLKNCQLK